MKRIFLAIITISAMFNAMGQEWTKVHTDGDELLGVKPSTGMVYTDGQFTFIMDDNETTDFCLIAPTIFNYETGMYRGAANGGERVYGVVGFYDSEGNLIKKIDKYVFETLNVASEVHSNKYTHTGGNNGKNAQGIINYLINGNGYVRFVLPLYNSNTRFDLKVQCLNNTAVSE